MHQVRNERLEVGNNRINICHKTQAKKNAKVVCKFPFDANRKRKTDNDSLLSVLSLKVVL